MSSILYIGLAGLSSSNPNIFSFKGPNREKCIIIDQANYDVWTVYLQEVSEWEAEVPKAAKTFNVLHPRAEKERLQVLRKLKKYAELY